MKTRDYVSEWKAMAEELDDPELELNVEYVEPQSVDDDNPVTFTLIRINPQPELPAHHTIWIVLSFSIAIASIIISTMIASS